MCKFLAAGRILRVGESEPMSAICDGMTRGGGVECTPSQTGSGDN